MGISNPVIKKDHLLKASGKSIFVDDCPKEGMLFGKILRSSKAKAEILGINLPQLPQEYIIVDHNDVPGENKVQIVLADTPVFANKTVEYIGDPILMVVGPDEKIVEQILNKIEINYKELIPIINMEEHDTVFFDYSYSKGDVTKAFAEADKIYEEKFYTGLQEQAYLEPNGMIAEFNDGKVTIHGSIQCPYYVHKAVAVALGFEANKVQIIQDVTGGGFGGKEDYPSILACQAAVAACKVDKPVRVIFDRKEDMEFTSKRHPSCYSYKVSVKNNKITAMDIDAMVNGGAYTTLSLVVLQRGIIGSCGAYNVENLSVRGRAVKTNTVPTGAFRGFGGPQAFFGIEMMMNHIAKNLNIDSLKFKEAHLSKQGDLTSTSGKYHFPVPIPAMIDEIDKLCHYREKRELYKNQTGRLRRGIGISLFFHGAGFTGSGERDLIKAVAKLRKYKDGTIEILTANADIGQGLKTTFSKIVAKELNIPYEDIMIVNPDTDRVPDSGPTVASRSIMVVGELLRRCAIKLKEEWIDGEDQTVEEYFKEPEFVIPFDIEKFHGDAYPTYSWGVNAVELEVDTLTGTTKVLGAYGSFDVGTPIDLNVVIGQMEGGLLQGIGYASCEQMNYDKNGRIRNNSFTDYIIPTSVDVPNLQCVVHVEEYPDGPYGAKGAGELPTVGAAPAYLHALEQALGESLNHIPFTAEDTMKVFERRF